MRVEKRSTVDATRFGYDGTTLRRETNVTNNPLVNYDWASGRILRSRSASLTRYAQHDALKTPTRWSRADGGEQARASFDAWGNLATSSGVLPNVRYTGYYADVESESYYAQQRYYAQGLGRFNRVDPWQGDGLRPITLNKYAYANDNPLIYSDPDGQSATAVGALGGLVYGVTQGVGRSIYNGWNGYPQHGWENFGSLVAQNTIAGAEIGLAIDASRLGANPLGGAIVGGAGAAGISGLTFDGTAKPWDDFSNAQMKYGAGGAVAGATLTRGGLAAPLYGTVAARLGIQGLSGATAGYSGDFTTQSVELATGDRSEYDTGRLGFSALVGLGANLLPAAYIEAHLARLEAQQSKSVVVTETQQMMPPPVEGLVSSTSQTSKRQKYMGRGPDKYSRTGRQVVERMREDGLVRGEGPLLRGNPNRLTIEDAQGNWIDIGSRVDMAHRIDAVTWWNEIGRTFGQKSPAVRQFMLDAENYFLQDRSLNRSAGAKLGQRYLPPEKNFDSPDLRKAEE